ncbi:4855_t:CDS:2, partial [Gigaspora margarita]
SIFENHVDDFFKYATKQTWISKNDPHCKVKWYLDEPITQKTTNILTWWKHNKEAERAYSEAEQTEGNLGKLKKYQSLYF